MKTTLIILSILVTVFSGVSISGSKEMLVDFTFPTLTESKQIQVTKKLQQIEKQAYLQYGDSRNVVNQLRFNRIKTRLASAKTYLQEKMPHYAKQEINSAETMLNLPEIDKLPGFY